MGLKYGISHSIVSKIRRGLIYSDIVSEYVNMEKQERASWEETILLHNSKAYYYLDSKYLRISVDDLLISLDLDSKKIISIKFNAIIRGSKIEYMTMVRLLEEKGFLK